MLGSRWGLFSIVKEKYNSSGILTRGKEDTAVGEDNRIQNHMYFDSSPIPISKTRGRRQLKPKSNSVKIRIETLEI